MAHDYDVVVIGGGPVGATSLALLGAVGLSAIGIEREAGVWTTARAVHFDGETVRTLQTLGIADEAMTYFQPMRNYRMENEAGEILVGFSTGAFGSQAWHDAVMFHQPDIETLLRACLERFRSVNLRCGTRFAGLEQDADGVRSTVENPDGSTEVVMSRWVIAADGATSSVRQLLGVETERARH